jgi:hypothetical protein
MQEIYQVDRQPLSDFTGRADPAAFGGPAGAQAMIRRRITEARVMACAGDARAARALCADIVLEHQFRLHDDRDLLREAVGALIRARAFQMLSRLLLSVDGRRIRVSVAGVASGAAGMSAFIRQSEEGGTELYSVEENLFHDPSCDAIIDRWSEKLIATGGEAAATAAV